MGSKEKAPARARGCRGGLEGYHQAQARGNICLHLFEIVSPLVPEWVWAPPIIKERFNTKKYLNKEKIEFIESKSTAFNKSLYNLNKFSNFLE